jgi:hypothetical protein
MTDDTLLPFDLPAVRGKKLPVDFAGGRPVNPTPACCCARRSAGSACAGGLLRRCLMAATRVASGMRCSSWPSGNSVVAVNLHEVVHSVALREADVAKRQ